MMNRAFALDNYCEIETPQPEWFRAERYEYCEPSSKKNNMKSKKEFHLPTQKLLSFFL